MNDIDDGGKAIEGWSDMRPGDRVYHYMVNGTSLCGRVGFHSMHPDTISPQGWPCSPQPQKKDCRPCFRKMFARLTLIAEGKKRG